MGQIYTDEKDSLGNPAQPYTAAHWNGRAWELIRFAYKLSETYLEQIRALGIWYFSDKNIWLTSGSIFHYNGKISELIYRPDLEHGLAAEHFWAFSENDIYAVGDGGLMVHYDGSSWKLITTPTTLRFRDIWGYRNPRGEKELWLVAADDDKTFGAVLKYDREGWHTLFDENTRVYDDDDEHNRARAVWGTKESIYLCMIGPYDVNIYKHNRLNFTEYKLFYNQKNFPIVDIDGRGANDIFFAGYKDGIAHYNGKSFKTYNERIMKDARFESVAQTKDAVFCVGGFFSSNNGIVVVGKRQD